MCFYLIVSCFIFMLFIVYNEYHEKNYFDRIDSVQLEEYMKIPDLFVFYYKTDCVPCLKFKRKLNLVIENTNDKYQIKGIHVGKSEQDESLIKKYKLQKSPTFIYYKNGIELNRLEGNVSYEELEFFIKDKLK